MRLIKLITTMVFLTLPLLGFTPKPTPQQTITTQGAPTCRTNTYLPLMMNGSNGTQLPATTVSNETAVSLTTAVSHQTPTTNHRHHPDFNGDGCADLAIGVPGEGDSVGNQGAVHVLYGSSDGVTTAYQQRWDREGGYDGDNNFLGAIQGAVRTNDGFGATLATNDFNNDGYTDLAIGVPYANISSARNAGAVQILYGSPTGLLAEGNQMWSQTGAFVDPEGDGIGTYLGDVYDIQADNEEFGSALATGNFNNDDYPDLAVGVYKQDINGQEDAGAAHVFYGSETGLTWVGNQFWSQGGGHMELNGSETYVYLGDIIGGVEDGDWFGNALAAGDFDNDGYDDLAIGNYGEGLGSLDNAGAVNILEGSFVGLTVANNQHWHQEAAYIDNNGDGTIDVTIGNPAGTEEANDWFGFSLAVGDFDNNNHDDLAVGVPHEHLYIDGIEYTDTGVVQIFYSYTNGLSLTNEQFWDQDGEFSLGNTFGSDPESGDEFGRTLAVGDMNGDGYDDLAIGAPYESFSSTGSDVGTVNIFVGSDNGLDIPNHLWISQGLVIDDNGNQLGALVGMETAFNNFGAALSTADFNNDGYDELTIGIPQYSSDGSSSSQIGALSILWGSPTGPTVSGNQLWSQDGGMDDNGTFLGDLLDDGEDTDLFAGGLP